MKEWKHATITYPSGGQFIVAIDGTKIICELIDLIKAVSIEGALDTLAAHGYGTMGYSFNENGAIQSFQKSQEVEEESE